MSGMADYSLNSFNIFWKKRSIPIFDVVSTSLRYVVRIFLFS